MEKKIDINETDLRNGNFYFKYQPIVNGNGEICSLEALLRFNNHNEVENIVAMLEETSLITVMTQPALEIIFADIKKLIESGCTIPISFNLSPSQLKSKGIASLIIKKLEAANIPKELFIIEITEHYFVDKSGYFIENIKIFNSAGIKLRLDDFGRGFSSLTTLSTIDFQTVKVDKSFVVDLNRQSLGFTIIEALKVIGEKHNFTVIVEGVETEEQFQLLSSAKIDYFQGFYFGKPQNLHSIINQLMKS